MSILQAAQRLHAFQKITKLGEPAQANAKNHPIVLQQALGLMWSKAPLGDAPMTDAESKAAIAACNLGGLTDWREPTVDELYLLHDRSRCDPAIDTDFFTCPLGWYRTSTAAAWSSSDVWFVDAHLGFTDGLHRDDTGWVRVCRSVSPAAAGQ